MRLFFCLELPEDVRAKLAGVSARLATRLGTGVRWVVQENLHVTLRFLGEVAPEHQDALAEAATRIAESEARVRLALDRLGAFPTPRRAHVVWAGSEAPCPAFKSLAGALEDALTALGFEREARAPVPHVTLARLRIPRDVAAALSSVRPPAMTVELASLTLMRSELDPQGPRYTPLERFALGGEDGV